MSPDHTQVTEWVLLQGTAVQDMRLTSVEAGFSSQLTLFFHPHYAKMFMTEACLFLVQVSGEILA